MRVPQAAQDLLKNLLYPDFKELFDSRNHPVSPNPETIGQDFVRCPYKDARYLHANRMNRTALGIVSEHYPYLLRTMADLGAAYKFHQNITLLGPLDFWRIWVTAYGIPVLWLSMQSKQQKSTIPQPLSALYKISIGFVDTLSGVIMYLREDEARQTLEDEERFFEFLDFNKILIGRSEVCAGSAGMIKSLMKVIYESEKSPLHDSAGIPYASLLEFSEILFLSILARIQLLGRADVLDSCFTMRPRVRMKRLRLDSISGRSSGPVHGLEALLSQTNQCLESIAARSFPSPIARASVQEYAATLRLLKL